MATPPAEHKHTHRAKTTPKRKLQPGRENSMGFLGEHEIQKMSKPKIQTGKGTKQNRKNSKTAREIEEIASDEPRKSQSTTRIP